jgi:hypothetical protein
VIGAVDLDHIGGEGAGSSATSGAASGPSDFPTITGAAPAPAVSYWVRTTTPALDCKPGEHQYGDVNALVPAGSQDR